MRGAGGGGRGRRQVNEKKGLGEADGECQLWARSFLGGGEDTLESGGLWVLHNFKNIPAV